jgi:Leu/Phe-tRNA-protein transferase
MYFPPVAKQRLQYYRCLSRRLREPLFILWFNSILTAVIVGCYARQRQGVLTGAGIAYSFSFAYIGLWACFLIIYAKRELGRRLSGLAFTY